MALDTAGDGWRPRMTANGMLSAGGGRMRSDMTSAPAFAQSRGDARSFRLRPFPNRLAALSVEKTDAALGPAMRARCPRKSRRQAARLSWRRHKKTGLSSPECFPHGRDTNPVRIICIIGRFGSNEHQTAKQTSAPRHWALIFPHAPPNKTVPALPGFRPVPGGRSCCGPGCGW